MTYTPDEFYEKIADLSAKIGELWAIDAALDDFNNDGSNQYTPETGLGQPFRNVTLGRTTPFELTHGGHAWQGVDAETLKKVADGYLDTGDAWAAELKDSLTETFRFVIEAKADDFQAAHDAMRIGVTDPVGTLVGVDFALLQADLGDWEGDAADQFADYFYLKMPSCVANQQWLATSINLALAAGKSITGQGQQSLANVLDQTLEVVDGQLQNRHDDHQSTDSTAQDLVILGALVAGLVFSIPTGGASGVVTTGAVITYLGSTTASLLSYGASQVDSGEPRTADGIKAQEIASSLRENAEAILTNLLKQWQHLHASVVQPAGLALAAIEAEQLWTPQRPDLIHGVNPAEFHHESAPH